MPSYMRSGELPAKRHIQFRRPDGGLYAEELFSTKGFESVYSLLSLRYPRYGNVPNADVVQRRLALLEGGEAAIVLGSGMGATACALARPLLLAARADRVGEALGTILRQLRIATWLTGAPSAGALGAEHLA